jgi:hypothetical protein
MWINQDGTISGITLKTAMNGEELRQAFELGILNR